MQYIDDRSLSLIIRDAKNGGRKAMDILRNHSMVASKLRIIALYTELTSLNKSCEESLIRAETAAASLKTAGKEIDDTLLVTMVLKGLLTEYRTFVTVITQRETEVSLSEFKVQLKSFEEPDRSLQFECNDSIMKLKYKFNVKCYNWHELGHVKAEYKSTVKSNTNTRWCNHCKSTTHNTSYCRKMNSAKSTRQLLKEV